MYCFPNNDPITFVPHQGLLKASAVGFPQLYVWNQTISQGVSDMTLPWSAVLWQKTYMHCSRRGFQGPFILMRTIEFVRAATHPFLAWIDFQKTSSSVGSPAYTEQSVLQLLWKGLAHITQGLEPSLFVWLSSQCQIPEGKLIPNQTQGCTEECWIKC